MIEIKNISKSFKNNFWESSHSALSGVSLKVKNGEIVGLLGQNGSGKTTLLKIILKFISGDSGEVIHGERLLKSGLVDFGRIGYLPENAYLYPFMTGIDFLKYTSQLNDVSKKNFEKSSNYWGERLGIKRALKKQIRSFSKGMQQRLTFISIIMHSPSFIILDEPFSGLDPLGRAEFKKILIELKSDGKTILFTTHLIVDVEEICDSVIVLEAGKVIVNDKVQTILNKAVGFTIIVRVRGCLKNNIKTPLISLSHQMDEMSLEVDGPNLNSIIKESIEQNLEIVSIENKKVSLESIFFKEIKKNE